MAGIKLTDFTAKSIMPVVTDPEIQKLLPDRLTPQHVSFDLRGVSNAMSNGILRTIQGELPVWCMTAAHVDISTDEVFIIPEHILRRLRMIPIDQSTPADTTFVLNAVNDTAELMDVTTASITRTNSRGKNERLPFDSNIVICTLRPSRKLKIDNIRLVQDYSYKFAGHVVACHGVSTAEDVTPINNYEHLGTAAGVIAALMGATPAPPEADNAIEAPAKAGKTPAEGKTAKPASQGVPSRMSNPRHWRIQFDTNGTMAPKDIVKSACANLIERVDRLLGELPNINKKHPLYVLTVSDESDTLGNLFMKTIIDMNPTIPSCTYTTGATARVMSLQLNLKSENAEDIIRGAARYIKSSLEEISSFL